MTYMTRQEKQRIKRMETRGRAIKKIAGDQPPTCAICGCPHAEILHIAHPKHRDGRWHRKELGGRKLGSRNMVAWVLRTPIDKVLERVQLECPYCNAWHNRFTEYPSKDKQPKW